MTLYDYYYCCKLLRLAIMDTQRQLLTPSTYAGSDFGTPQRAGATLQRKWSVSSSSGATKRRSKQQREHAEQQSNSAASSKVVPRRTTKPAKATRHVFKRALHKVGKRLRQRPAEAAPAVSAVEAMRPPKVGAFTFYFAECSCLQYVVVRVCSV